jgi:hypothetical protein
MTDRFLPPQKRDWKPAFLASLRLTGNKAKSCEAAGITYGGYKYAMRHDAEFKEHVADALEEAGDLLEAEARRRAYEGVPEPVIYKGQIAGVWVDDSGAVVPAQTPGSKLVPLTVKKYSDVLLIFLLKGALPSKYRDNVRAEQTVAIGYVAPEPKEIEETVTRYQDAFRKLFNGELGMPPGMQPDGPKLER